MSVYSEVQARAYRYHLDNERPGEFALFEQYASRHGGPILELACGAGRVTLPLVRAGYDVVGIDLSEPMLAVARWRIMRAGSKISDRVTILSADMSEFSFPRKFPLIIIPFTSFRFNLTITQAEECLRCIVEHLARGGAFLIDDPKNDYFRGWGGITAEEWWQRAAHVHGFAFRYLSYDAYDLGGGAAPQHTMLVGYHPYIGR